MIDHIFAAIRPQLIILTIVYLLVLFVIFLDLWAGIRKARKRGELRSSLGYRKTVEKIAKYFNLIFVVTAIDAVQMLTEAHYPVGSVDRCVAELMRRLRQGDAFPHEIGFFLGYPYDDVVGFIENKGKNSLCSGCWKVYCDECEARKTFRRFDKCKEMYRLMFQKGKTVCQLTIAA